MVSFAADVEPASSTARAGNTDVERARPAWRRPANSSRCGGREARAAMRGWQCSAALRKVLARAVRIANRAGWSVRGVGSSTSLAQKPTRARRATDVSTRSSSLTRIFVGAARRAREIGRSRDFLVLRTPSRAHLQSTARASSHARASSRRAVALVADRPPRAVSANNDVLGRRALASLSEGTVLVTALLVGAYGVDAGLVASGALLVMYAAGVWLRHAAAASSALAPLRPQARQRHQDPRRQEDKTFQRVTLRSSTSPHHPRRLRQAVRRWREWRENRNLHATPRARATRTLHDPAPGRTARRRRKRPRLGAPARARGADPLASSPPSNAPAAAAAMAAPETIRKRSENCAREVHVAAGEDVFRGARREDGASSSSPAPSRSGDPGRPRRCASSDPSVVTRPGTTLNSLLDVLEGSLSAHTDARATRLVDAAAEAAAEAAADVDADANADSLRASAAAAGGNRAIRRGVGGGGGDGAAREIRRGRRRGVPPGESPRADTSGRAACTRCAATRTPARASPLSRRRAAAHAALLCPRRRPREHSSRHADARPSDHFTRAPRRREDARGTLDQPGRAIRPLRSRRTPACVRRARRLFGDCVSDFSDGTGTA